MGLRDTPTNLKSVSGKSTTISNSTATGDVNTTYQTNSIIRVLPVGGDGTPIVQSNTLAPRDVQNITRQGTATQEYLDDSDSIRTTTTIVSNKALQNTTPGFPFDVNNQPVSSIQRAVETTSRMVAQQLWNYKVTLFNHYQPKYELSPNAIDQLIIDDDSLLWPFRGSIIIDNRVEGFERSTVQDGFYHIRADARDEIDITIWPTEDSSILIAPPKEIWELTCNCVIYDVEDLPCDKKSNKKKRLYFWDKRFQFLQEKTIQWATATGPRLSWFINKELPVLPEHAFDEERSLYTGEAIASLLAAAGYADIINPDKWDLGAGKICCSLHSGKSVWDMISWVLNQHVSREKKDICSLRWNRGLKLLELIPYHKLYEDAGKDENKPGKLQIEHFFLEDYSWDGEKTTKTTSPWKAPFSNEVSFEVDIKSTDYSRILSYQFHQTSGLDSSKAFLSKPVYSHWHERNQFQVDVKENNITSVKDYFKKQYVEPLLGNEYPVMVLNKTKTDQYAIDPVYSNNSILAPAEDRFNRSALGKGTVLYAGIHLNQCLTITVQGSTHRLSGTFIGVDRLEPSDTDYDYQVCGQYLVISVKHILQKHQYTNEITLVKVHAYDKLKDEENIP